MAGDDCCGGRLHRFEGPKEWWTGVLLRSFVRFLFVLTNVLAFDAAVLVCPCILKRVVSKVRKCWMKWNGELGIEDISRVENVWGGGGANVFLDGAGGVLGVVWFVWHGRCPVCPKRG